ncbi:MAG TPA: GntR family transcriptional regulator [Parvularculaceae bacterium]|nr:GntR family transcriptional regulator [Parvularculaceae bacterium]
MRAGLKKAPESKNAKRDAAGHDRIYDQLLVEIIDGTLAPGTRLVESKLAARLGVSRTPVREALFRLHQQGFVLTSLGRGFSVKELDEREPQELFPILAALEAFALSLSAPILALDVAELRRANKALSRFRKRPLEAIAADTAFHQLLLRRCPNARLIAMIDSVRRQLLRYEYVYMADESLIDLSMAQHEEIIDCIARSDFAGAGEALHANYDSGNALVLSKLSRR